MNLALVTLKLPLYYLSLYVAAIAHASRGTLNLPLVAKIIETLATLDTIEIASLAHPC